MIRRFQGLHHADPSAVAETPNGMFLVRVQRAQYRWHAQKPYYLVRFVIVEPQQLAEKTINGRLYCTTKALWKFTWFLRDFGYDSELLSRDEVDDKNLLGLTGVVKISHVVINGSPLINFEGFAPASHWEELFIGYAAKVRDSEVAL